MALLTSDINTLPITSATDLQSSSPVKSSIIGAIIAGQHTDIVINEYKNRIFVIISQYKKLGALLTVYKDSAKEGDEREVYKVRTLLGKDDITQDVAARFLAEQTCMLKPALFSICLKDNSFATLVAIKDIILEKKTW